MPHTTDGPTESSEQQPSVSLVAPGSLGAHLLAFTLGVFTFRVYNVRYSRVLIGDESMSSQPAEKPRDEGPPTEDPIPEELPPPMEPQEIREGDAAPRVSSDVKPADRGISGGTELQR